MLDPSAHSDTFARDNLPPPLTLALLILGPKRLPAAGRSLGRGISEFKDGITGRTDARADLPAGRETGEPDTSV